MADGTVLTLVNKIEGITINRLIDSNKHLFKNQDWYKNQFFAEEDLELGEFKFEYGYLKGAGGVPPKETSPLLPSAVSCVWVYVYLNSLGVQIWEENFVWCRDVDNNFDRVYVGMSGIDKKFEIHRHLTLQPYHGYAKWSFDG